MSVQSNGMLNLDVIDDAFGTTSDLYRDVLQIPQNAGPGQIHDAYFDRRDNLYEALSSIDSGMGGLRERREAEKKMDAVVCAIRVLGDPGLRASYDNIRSKRIRKGRMSRRKTKMQKEEAPDLNATTATGSTMISNDESFEPKSRSIPVSYAMEDQQVVQERTPPAGVRRPAVSVSPEKQDRGRRLKSVESVSVDGSTRITVTPDKSQSIASSKRSAEQRDDSSHSSAGSSIDDDGTMMTTETFEPKPPEGFFDRIKAEVVGALDDTSRTFEQVFSAFTLQEEEIQAVVGKIDRVKLQMRSGSVVQKSATPGRRGRSRSVHSKSPSKVRKSKR